MEQPNAKTKKYNVDDVFLWEKLGVPKWSGKKTIDAAYKKIFGGNKTPKEIHLAWKILRDPYFGSAYYYFCSTKKIFEAGFFNDGAEPEYDDKNFGNPLWISTPINKIIERLESENIKKTQGAKNKYVVLLSTGAFSPIHDAHIKMMEIARYEIIKRGFIVLGGYISPSHDDYVSVKNNRAAKLHSALRLKMCSLALKNSDWLMVDGWEARYAKIALNYTDVIERTKKYLARHIKTEMPIEVVYVFGGDNAGFARAFIKRGRCVCVARPGYEKMAAKIAKEPLIHKNPRIIFSKIVPKGKDVSSTVVRSGDYSCVNKDVAEMLCLLNKKTSQGGKARKKFCYVVRNDVDWALKNWKSIKNRGISKKDTKKLFNEVSRNLLSALNIKNQEGAFNPSNIYMCYVDSEQQKKIINIIRKNKKVISMDIICEGDYNMDASRVFALSGDQMMYSGLSERPGREDIKKQISKIPKGKYVLVDDDIVTGQMINNFKKMLPPRVHIERSIALLDFSKKFFIFNRHSKNIKLPVYDIVDFRDFWAGVPDGGLVVRLPSGKLARTPYMLPYVSLVSRAKLPAQSEVDFSIKLWKANENFYKKANPKILLKNADPSFRALMQYIGFKPNDTLESICRLHKSILLNTKA